MKPNLKELRNNLGFTQKQVSELVGISRSYYTKIELGIKKPTVEVAKKIAKALEFNWVIFFEDECSLKEQKTA